MVLLSRDTFLWCLFSWDTDFYSQKQIAEEEL